MTTHSLTATPDNEADSSDPSRTSNTALVRTFLLALGGILCIQAAWSLVVPPFRGLDEHDHAYKASAVAHGDWDHTHEASPQGWGQFVEVPTDIVESARPVCEEFPYTTRDNCVGHSTTDTGITRVASSAAHYNPAYYVIPGLASTPFDGAAALYAMRIAGGLMCAVLLGLAVVALRSWSRTPWPAAALLLAATPTMTYTMSMNAPNGLELTAALALWVALLGIARRPDRRPACGLVALAGLASVPLAVVRGLGPLWLLLIVSTVALLLPWKALGRIVRNRWVVLAATAATVATVYACWWTLASRSTEVTGRYHFEDSPWAALPEQWVLWFFQSMGVFPARDELANLGLYVVGFAAWGLLVLYALRRTTGRDRLALLTVVVVATAIASALTVATYESIGAAWQGRYSYPYTLGFLLICGLALDRRARWSGRWPVFVAGIATCAMLLIGQLKVLGNQVRTSSLAGSEAWLQPSPLLIVALNIVGAGLLVWSLTPRRRHVVAG